MPSLDGILSISFPHSRQPGLRQDTVRAWVAEFEFQTQSSERALEILEDTVEDSFLGDYEFEHSGDVVDLTMTSDSCSSSSSVIMDLT